MQSVSLRIWTRVAVSISYDDNHYTTGTSLREGGQYFLKKECSEHNTRLDQELMFYFWGSD